MSALENLIEMYTDLLYPHQGLGLGKNVRFPDNSMGISSEVAWSDFVRDLNKFFETQGTIPVDIKKFFHGDTNLLSTVGMLGNEAQQELMKHNLNIAYDRTTGEHDYGIARYRPSNRPALYDEDDTSIAITDPGYDAIKSGLQSVDMHEYIHYIDALAAEGSGEHRMSDIMKSYSNDDGSPMTRDQLYARWMDDPRTSHLDLDNPENAGLRELLMNRSHHGGVVDLREGFGDFLATALSDPNYKSRVLRIYPSGGSLEDQTQQDYLLGGQEMFARGGGNILRPPKSNTFDEGFTPGLFQGMDKGLADSLATLLNSMR